MMDASPGDREHRPVKGHRLRQQAHGPAGKREQLLRPQPLTPGMLSQFLLSATKRMDTLTISSFLSFPHLEV